MKLAIEFVSLYLLISMSKPPVYKLIKSFGDGFDMQQFSRCLVMSCKDVEDLLLANY